jgi:hypothetical protein
LAWHQYATIASRLTMKVAHYPSVG